MTHNNRLKRIANRLAALEEELLPPPEIDLHWIPPEPCAADEELVITHEERSGNGWFRIFEKRKKQK